MGGACSRRITLELVLVKWGAGSLHSLPVTVCLTPPQASSILAWMTNSKDNWFQRSNCIPASHYSIAMLSYLSLQRNKFFVHYEVFVESLRKKNSSRRNGALIWIEPVWFVSLTFDYVFPCDGILILYNVSNRMYLLFLNGHFLTAFWKEYTAK